jgi:hypothetical protein
MQTPLLIHKKQSFATGVATPYQTMLFIPDLRTIPRPAKQEFKAKGGNGLKQD